MKFAVAAAVPAVLCLWAAKETLPRPADQVRDRLTPAVATQLDGYAGDRFRVNLRKRLQAVNPADLLEPYLRRPGKQAWIGEHAPRFLDAVITAWAATNDPALRSVADETLDRLLAAQQPDGYLGTYAADQRWQDFDIWTQRHVLSALLSYHRQTGRAEALDAAQRLAGLLIQTFGEGNGQRNFVLTDNYRGVASATILEPMAELYRQTGSARYLNFCRYVLRAWEAEPGPKLISTLLSTGSVGAIPSRRSAEILTVLNGLTELHRITGDATLWKPIEMAWRDIVSNRLYPTGATGWGRTFREERHLRADNRDNTNGPGDGATTSAWLDLNWNLLRLTGEARFADEIERTVYNALFGAQHPSDGRFNFVSPMAGRKRYGQVDQGMTGVNSSASALQRSFAMLPNFAFGNRDGAVAVNLYFAGRATVPVAAGAQPLEVSLRTETNFPVDGNVSLFVTPSRRASFPVELRVPGWCGTFRASIAGESYTGAPGEYLRIAREWTDATRVEIAMDMTPRVVSGAPSYPGQVAIVRGPQVLAVDESFDANHDAWLAGLRTTNGQQPKLTVYSGERPKNWIYYSHAYSAEGYIGNESLSRKASRLVFVPYAEAGQAGTEFRVWLPSSP